MKTITRDNFRDVLTDMDIETLELWLKITTARFNIINRNLLAHPGEQTAKDKLKEREYSQKLLTVEQTAMTVIDLYKRNTPGIVGLTVDDIVFKRASILLDPGTYDLDDTDFWGS